MLAGLSWQLAGANKASERGGRGYLARNAPLAELGHVYAPVAGLAVVDPRLRLPDPRSEFPLGELGLLPELSEEDGDVPVVP